MGKLRAHDRGMERMGNGGEVVEEATLAAQERVVLDPLERATYPEVVSGRRHRAYARG